MRNRWTISRCERDDSNSEDRYANTREDFGLGEMPTSCVCQSLDGRANVFGRAAAELLIQLMTRARFLEGTNTHPSSLRFLHLDNHPPPPSPLLHFDTGIERRVLRRFTPKTMRLRTLRGRRLRRLQLLSRLALGHDWSPHPPCSDVSFYLM